MGCLDVYKKTESTTRWVTVVSFSSIDYFVTFLLPGYDK